MLQHAYDIKKLNTLKDLINQLCCGIDCKQIMETFRLHFKDVHVIELLLLELELLNNDLVSVADLKTWIDQFLTFIAQKETILN